MNNTDHLTAYLASFIDELALNSVKHAVISPGSRSTPLALLLAEHPNIEVHINIDERSASFFALGLAKALREPVILVCTSGTAAANYYPAVIEAFYARVPLVVLTADRPHELRHVGAPQAIDQIDLYGKHVKWSVEMALPENSLEMKSHVRMIGSRAVATAKECPAGPIHLNFPLREPLVPNWDRVKEYRKEEKKVSVKSGSLRLSEMENKALADMFQTTERGMIIVGELQNEAAIEDIVSLSRQLGYPILADPLSHLRSGSHKQEFIVDTYDTFLRDSAVKEVLIPDVVLRFGAMPVSKPLLLFLKKNDQAKHLVIDGGIGWREPANIATNMIYCNEQYFCQDLIAQINERNHQEWLNTWLQLNQTTKAALQSIHNVEELNEGKVFALLPELMPENSTIFASNSMPIRDLDTFFFNNEKNIHTFANRGANGIDGVVSTALGVSAVLENTVLVIGDLSFYHDMNGLLAAKLQKQNLTIVLINNDGGGIFSFLPQASEKEYFELLFGTPHGLDFSHAAALYGANYDKVENWDEFKHAFAKSFSMPGLKIIEVQTNRDENLIKHRELWKYVSREIKEVIE